jgi:diguanylate cyclase (GGDEF)-like protein
MPDIAALLARLEILFDNLGIASLMLDGDARATSWNREFLNLFPEHAGAIHHGEPYAENLRRFYRARLDAVEIANLDTYVADGVERHRRQIEPFEFQHRGRWLRAAVLPMPGLGRLRTWTVHYPSQDGESLALQIAHAGKRPALGAMEHIADGLMARDPVGHILLCNRRFAELYRLESPEHAIGRTFPELLHHIWAGASGAEAAHQRWADNSRFPGAPFELPLPEDRWLRVREYRSHDGSLVSTHVDVTDLVRLQRQAEKLQSELQSQLHTDSTTGIGSRVWFLAELDHAVARANAGEGSWALLMLDLDLFKQINDSLGHQMGDKVLALVAGRIADAAGPNSSVARVGGDEFAVIFPYRDISEVSALCARLQARVAERAAMVFGGELRLRTSIGVALLPDDATTSEVAYRNADLALRASKGSGRNAATYFSKNLNDANQREAHIARLLYETIERRQFDLHFQPQFKARSLKVLGCEALLRWKHPVEGFIPPAEFVPVAEKNGLISAIGGWVLKTACRRAQDWIAAGLELPRISVNISAIQLWQPDFLSQVREALDSSGLPGERLCLEITESVLVGHSRDMIHPLIVALRELGVGIALDDFGTGYSSLSYLNSLTLDEVKIDRSFITNADEDGRKRRVLTGIVALAKGLGLSIIAEGAETKGEVDLLRDLECEGIQGYFFSRPLPAPQLVEELARLPHQAARKLSRSAAGPVWRVPIG